MFVVLALAALVGCSKSDPDPDPAGSGPYYYGDVQPILNAQCSRCHTEGGIAPSSFDDPATVVLLAAAIRSATQEGLMPPPAPDPECAPYANSDDWTLSDADKTTIAAWVDAGAPLGDPGLAVSAPGPVTSAPFDVELFGGAAYTPVFDGTGDDYRCFRLDVNNASTTYMTGFEAIIDQSAEVHHVVVFRDVPGDSDPNPTGFPCGGFGEPGWEFLAGWAPGAGPGLFPDGAGLAFEPSSTLVLQMHYFGAANGTGTPDRSGFGLHTSDTVTNEVISVPFGVQEFTIPAGEVHSVSDTVRWAPGSGKWKFLGAWPHMHQLGSALDLQIERKDESEACLVEMDGWNFHNQLVAMLDSPADLGPGDKLTLSCTWDNREKAVNPKQFADPPQDVGWGEGSYDEMCFAFTYLMAP